MLYRLKKNRFVRGVYYLLKDYFGFRTSRFGSYGTNITLVPPIVMPNPENVYLSDNVWLNKATVLTTNAKFIMKANSVAASGLNVVTGNHARIVGIPFREINEDMKPKGYDADVVVEEDVWMGANVTLLSGVTVRRGTTVAAGAVVTKSMPPYCVCGGVPAKVIKFYWTIEQIMEHEEKLYAPEDRYTRQELEEYCSKSKI